MSTNDTDEMPAIPNPETSDAWDYDPDPVELIAVTESKRHQDRLQIIDPGDATGMKWVEADKLECYDLTKHR